MKDYKYKKSMLFLFLLFIASLLMCVGYGAINAIELKISGIAKASPEDLIYISKVENLTGNYDETNTSVSNELLVLNNNISLLNNDLNSFVEYEVTISNNSDYVYGYKGERTDSNFYSNNDIIYEVSDIDKYDEILSHGTKKVKVKFKYNDSLASINDNTLSALLSLDFGRVYSVTYTNETGDLPSKAYEGEDLVVNIGKGYTGFDIKINGVQYNNYKYINGVLTINGNDIMGNVEITTSKVAGTVSGTVAPTTLDLSTLDNKVVTLTVNNTYLTPITYNVGISNNKFELTDSNGNNLSSFVVSGSDSDVRNFYIKRKSNAEFNTDTETTHLVLNCNNGDEVNTNNITIQVPSILDVNPPTINEIGIDMDINTGSISATWTGQDDKASTITYTVNLYDNNNNLIATKTSTKASGASNTVQFTTSDSRNIGTVGTFYYVKIYGDDGTNSGESELAAATTSTTICRASTQVGRYSVTQSGSNYTSSYTSSYVKANSAFEATFTPTGTRTITGCTVSMGGKTLKEGTDYEISNNNKITIPNVTGNLTINITTMNCLVEGTKVLLADGSTKNVEDIDYTDLLLVWDFDNGEFTYEYPIWMEKPGKSSVYQKTTFSDGSSLKTVGYHGIFNVDLMKFVSMDDSKNFGIGTKVLKVDTDLEKNKLKEVEVTNIELVYENVNYYQILSTTYLAIITDDFITTNGDISWVNLYGFDEDYKWKLDRKEIRKNPNNLVSYEVLKGAVTNYMFEGMRVTEMKYLLNSHQISVSDLIKMILEIKKDNKYLVLPVPLGEDGYRYWMVTTSDDIVNENNKKDYLVKEGDYYTLPEPKNVNEFSYWYNTATGEKYNPGDKVQVLYGTHFVAK